MKKAVAIVFVFLALFFCFKDIILFSVSISTPSTYIIDLGEEEVPSKSEKSDTHEKDDIVEWQHFLNEKLLTIESLTEARLQIHKEKKHFAPYFEVYSPPPERI